MAEIFGYAGKALRVDLTAGTVRDETLEESLLSSAIGGTGLGVKYLYDEVPPAASWSDPVNRLVIASGPLAGTRASGSGTISVVTKGAMTNMTAATQANGFLGAFLKFCGHDAIVVQGAAADWVYLHLDENGAELRDARFLLGKDTAEIEEAVLGANPGRKYSVFGIGPAGERLVRFAAIVGDRGHVAAHNGVGAVMGSKRLKAIAVARGKRPVPVFDRPGLEEAAQGALARSTDDSGYGAVYRWGTGGNLSALHDGGLLPVKNYTTSVFPEHERVNGRYVRAHYEVKKTPCYACRFVCCRSVTITEGPYAGYSGEEPEYEGYAACGPVIGNTDPGAAVVLGNLVDRLGLDINEAGWVMGFAMECFERGLLSTADTGGLELRWGNVEAAAELLRRIARREGIGDLLADGVRVAAERLGGEALAIGIYTLKGSSPRGHDHRAKWDELLDTCAGNTGTIEGSLGAGGLHSLGLKPMSNRFDWEQVATLAAAVNGWRQWQDCLGICMFNFIDAGDQMAVFNAVTGRNLSIEDGMMIGRRIVHQMRLYNVRCGLTPAMEAPSARYGSTPVDGPAAGASVLEHWDEMRRSYYLQMGWDEETGRPTPETLTRIGLGHLVSDLAALE